MEAEDEPYKYTRSSGTQNRSSDKSTFDSSLMGDNNVFVTPEPQINSKKRVIKHVRTPSGNLMTSSVGDIRNFFELDQQQKTSSPKLCIGHSQGNTNNHRTVTDKGNEAQTTPSNSKVANNKSQSAKRDKSTKSPIDLQVNKPSSARPLIELFKATTKDGHQSDMSISDKRDNENYQSDEVSKDNFEVGQHQSAFQKLKEMVKTKGVKENACENDKNKQTDEKLMEENTRADGYINQQIQDNTPQQFLKENQQQLNGVEAETETSILKETERKQQPKVMDLQLVIQMFKEIKMDLNNFKKDTEVEKLRGITYVQDQQEESINGLKGELANSKIKNEVLSSVVCGLSKKVIEMEGRIAMLERRNTQNSVMISGYQFSKEKNQVKQLQDFFGKYLNLKDVNIDEHYIIGQPDQDSVPLVVTMSTLQEKQAILNNKAKLKNVFNSHGKQIYINDLQTPEIMDKRRREREIYNDNKANTASTIEMSFFRGGLKIQNETYRKKVMAPTPEEILKMTNEELSQTLAMKIKQGRPVVEMGNKFIAHSCIVQNHQQIRMAYTHMKLMYPEANHLINSYYIPGVAKHYNQDYWDDGDYGMGKHVLNLMVENNITSRAIFVARYSSTTKMGPKRFDAIRRAAKQVIDDHPYNTILKTKQTVKTLWPEKPKKNQDQQTEQKQVHKSGPGQWSQKPELHSFDGNGRNRYNSNPNPQSQSTFSNRQTPSPGYAPPSPIMGGRYEHQFTFASPQSATLCVRSPTNANQWPRLSAP